MKLSSLIPQLFLNLVVLLYCNSSLADESWESTRDNLYKRANGDVFYRSMMVKTNAPELPVAKEGEFYRESPNKELIYRYRDFLSSPDELKIKLRDKVDFSTWRQISSEYYADKNQVYYAQYDSSGGYLCMVPGLTPDVLQFFFEGRWQKWEKAKGDDLKHVMRHYVSDGKKIYYGDTPLKEVDSATFRVMEISNGLYDDIGVDKFGMFTKLSRWTKKDYENLKSNVLDDKGNIINKCAENLNWIKAYNRIATDGMLLPSGGK